MGWRGALLAFVAIAAVLAANEPAGAAGRCSEGLVRDYTKPLKRLPAGRYPASDEDLPFAPDRVFLRRLGIGQLLAGGGEIGYSLTFSPAERGQILSSPLGWQVDTRIARVDRAGTTLEVIRSTREEVRRLRPNASRTFSALVSKPGVYRQEVVLSDRAGRRLGHFYEYVRVLRRRSDVELTLNGASFHPGETVRATLLNRGTQTLSYGLGYRIDVFDGSSWSRSPVAPSQPVLAIGLSSGPGGRADCWSFTIPAEAPPGLYRFAWSGDAYYYPTIARRHASLNRYAEFRIPPG